ncbi:MAG TPA: YggS family pyridoxal phosphate-dependent enzyme [Brevundimonas sp.]|jgi:pyridoxal phosphate enzyme (YggS family)|uniref:YggS family pyridoxal phosphate-dependent enzyme n=1 Tax=Brevundimonas sp. TaxID=1871086 RepID=UPI002C976F04|nr:YggS family pyridoxal phosphate-dependent enzyme [Brevundimonas sp.]HRH19269.1 YggS family pyridoxal phosphate-dependent enzyme [Brevundimonas sp.]
MTSPHPALSAIRHKIERAARSAGRDPADVTLTAVCKQQPWVRIQPVLDAGQRVFGENRVQEAQARWAERRAGIPGLNLRLIGPLQSNKVREAVALFDAIESLDRESLAVALATEIARSGRAPELLIQVNTGDEPQKSGVSPREADAFIARCREGLGLTIAGLMCLPPADEEPAMHFALLGKIARRNGLTELSMGMSDDFETAVRHGATRVRVGSALFGGRGDRTGLHPTNEAST